MRSYGKLTALKVNKAKGRGYYNDGGGLYLSVSASGSKSWVFRFRVDNRLREMGLGPLHTVSLGEARELARECRIKRRNDIDPIEARNEVRTQARLERAKLITFQQATEQYAEAFQHSWSSLGHQKEWVGSLQRHIFPIIGNLPVQTIDTRLVLQALEKIWLLNHVSATRIRGRIENVLDWARAQGYREGENPARWKGHLENLLPKDIHQVEHFDALPYPELPAFMAKLQQHPDAAALALSFVILTVARVGMIRRMDPSEFNFEALTWTVPANRMKGRRTMRSEFRVPLSPQAQHIAQRLLALPPGYRGDTTTLALLRRLGYQSLTVHGFRSTFSDWCSEETNTPGELREMVLAHVITNRAEAAYRRGDLFEKRRELMINWAHFCFPSTIW
jgi:integrase